MQEMSNGILRRVCAFIVWSWLAASLLHGAAHVAAGAALTPLPPSLSGVGISVELFFSLGPLLALALLYTHWRRWGAMLLVVTMLIALLWGFGGHFLFPSGDNVMTHLVSPAAPAFLITSVLVFLIPWAGVTVGVYTFMQALQHPRVRGSAGRGGEHWREEEPRMVVEPQV
jgi:hypothetical protein